MSTGWDTSSSANTIKGVISGTTKFTLNSSGLALVNSLPVTSGGTGLNATTVGGLLVGSSTTALTNLPIGTNTQVLTSNGTTAVWGTAGGAGTVTSVALTAPSIFNVGGSPVTGSGTLALTYSGTPLPILNGGTAATTKAGAFDSLSPMTTGGDIIYGGASGTGTRLANGNAGQFLTSSGTTVAPTWTTGNIGTVTQITGDGTVISTGPLTDTAGNITLTTPTHTANTVYSGPSSGGAATATFRSLVNADVSGVGSSTPTASTLARWDANVNMSANSFIPGYTTTATASGTTTLTVASTYEQFFTGTLTQTVKLPVTSTLVLGQEFFITNNSSSAITITSSGSNQLGQLYTDFSAIVTCILTSGTGIASWKMNYIVPDGILNYVLQAQGANQGPIWASLTSIYTAPTVSRATATGTGTGSGGFVSGTYTTPTSPRTPLYLKITMVGAGGGGGGAGTSVNAAAGTGGNTTFNSTLLVANGGQGGNQQNGGTRTGGTTSSTAGPIIISSLKGGDSGGSNSTGGGVAPAEVAGGLGASSPFGGAGGNDVNATATSATANSGSGGGGASTAGGNITGNLSGSGGAAGGYIQAIITSPAATYTYSVGAGGTAGTGNGGGATTGGVGGSGIIIVEEYYQ